jgi:hypothetical protein
MKEEDLQKNYRIVESIERGGKRWYQIEKRFLWFFWIKKLLKKSSQGEAESAIKWLISNEIREANSKIVKKIILWYPKNN